MDIFFIDRDGEHFKTILGFLRNGKIDSSTEITESIKRESEFFQIPLLKYSEVYTLDFSGIYFFGEKIK